MGKVCKVLLGSLSSWITLYDFDNKMLECLSN